ncbi:MAG: beta-propeller domain-containing protein, partial [Candidatus Aenigmatarchaeota archaeon]
TYLMKGEKSVGGYAGTSGGLQGTADFARTTAPVAEEGGAGGKAQPSRVSDTNVQVSGINEPDIVKTDGQNIFFSTSSYWSNRKTKVINAYPPEKLNVSSEIKESGKLLLLNDSLVVISNEKVYGYDVSNPEQPKKEWDIELNGTVVGARMYKGYVYLVTKNHIDYSSPCPIRPMRTDGKEIVVRCTDIYHPPTPVPSDITYHASKFDAETGKVDETVSFVGSSENSIVYMSREGIYITYSHGKDRMEVMMQFIREESGDLFPERIERKVQELSEYNISSSAKIVELQTILQKYFDSLSDEERMRVQNELSNRYTKYYKRNMRKFERTGIIKISPGDMKIEEKGEIPGRPLNQFSIDEYKGNLRIATTVGNRDTSENDVYVLDENLDIIGSVKGLGLGQRVYSARFMDEKGYLVTYRQTDPFYVLDLSEPSNPEVKGKLKITGYSSYL